MAVLMADIEERRFTADRRGSKSINAERQKTEQALIVCGFILIALLAGLVLGYFGGAVKCEQVIRQNTAEAK